MHAVGGVDKSEWIQKQASPEQRLVHLTQGYLLSGGLPFLLDGQQRQRWQRVHYADTPKKNPTASCETVG